METLSEQLKDAIRESGVSVPEIASACGIHRQVIDRFLAGQRGIHLDSADRLAAYLGLKLIAGESSGKPAKKRRSR